jgi:hypothetical protein
MEMLDKMKTTAGISFFPGIATLISFEIFAVNG